MFGATVKNSCFVLRRWMSTFSARWRSEWNHGSKTHWTESGCCGKKHARSSTMDVRHSEDE